MAPLSKAVQEAGIVGIRRKAVPHTIQARHFFEESDEVRRLFARLVNAEDPSRIAIIPAASYGIATAAKNIRVRRGQNIVVTHEQFPGNVYVWRSLAQREQLELRTIEPPPDSSGRGKEWNARILEAIDPATAAVALGHVHWTDGTRFDLEKIGERAREFGAAFIVDGTQSVGALPFDVQRLRPDALVCAAYKWLLGPYSIGLAYYGPRYDDGVPLEETWIARRGSDDFRALVNYQDDYQRGAVRYDVGERSNFILVPMLKTGLGHVLEWGVAEIQEYCRCLMGDFLAEARELGCAVEDEAWRGSHIVGIRLPPGLDLDAVQKELAAANVFASLRGSALRVSPHAYNDAEDVAALREVLRGVVG
ncbi:MAG: aminotransferase class V-fold PLP-dependent enzyme [Gemmatimonadetes bacterium]|nr:aminotransferase class V-fold PLP-dependent enzyme [Gemmatimonadota bacterium]